ncbi:MAG: four helix bundle protein, partial [Saprospiraceae bacterium]|nr:four helix bundle protein [Saprospiraceae bacterium]
MRDSGNNVILEKSVLFSLKLIEYVEILEKDRKFVIANQLLRSGTSIGANIS